MANTKQYFEEYCAKSFDVLIFQIKLLSRFNFEMINSSFS